MSEAFSSVTGRVSVDADGRTWIDVPRRSACQSCGKSSACSVSVLGGLTGGQTTRLPVEGLDVREGQSVQLTCTSENLLKAAFLAYGLPALGVVAGGLCAAAAQGGDGLAFLGAALGLGLGVASARWLTTRGHVSEMTIYEE